MKFTVWPDTTARSYGPRSGIGKLLSSHLDLPGSTWNNGQQLIAKAMSAFGAIWLVSYLVFGLVGGLYYALGRDPESKRSTFPLFLVVAVALLIATVAFSAHPPLATIAGLALVATLSAIRILMTFTFCSHCGRIRRTGFRKRRIFCLRCGALVQNRGLRQWIARR